MSGAGSSLPAAPPQSPGLPENIIPLIFDNFSGINTQPTRLAIADSEMFWCDNFMPFGKNNLRSMPGEGNPIYVAAVGRTIISFNFFNIGNNTLFCILFLDDGLGEILKFDGTLWNSFYVFPSGTFVINAATGTYPAVSQWGSQYALIADLNGYWLFDGIAVYTTGTIAPMIKITNVGSGYSSAPTITVAGGSGSGATFTATVLGGQIVKIVPASPGAGYIISDGIGSIISVAINNPGSGGTDATGYSATVTGVATVAAGIIYDVVGGQVTNIQITNSGSGYTALPVITFTAPGLSGASATATLSIAPAELALRFTGGGGSGAAASIQLMPFGVHGSAIETYTKRVWIANNNTIIFSAPGNPIDFSTVNGGGVLTSTDSFLRAAYINLFQANGFLYVIADSSVNYISGVTTSGTPVLTTFSNVNIDPQVGTIWKGSIIPYSRYIIFATYSGIYAIVGGTVSKISSALDGIFDNLSPLNIGDFSPTSARAIVHGIKIFSILMPLTDPTTGVKSNKLILWDGKHWWTASQESNLLFLTTFEFDSVLSTYSTDGSNIFQIFTNYSATLPKTVQSKLYDTPGYIFSKAAVRLLSVIYALKPAALDINFQIDNETSGTVYNTSGLTDPRWTASGQKWFVREISQYGYLLGFTITTSEADITIQSVTALVQNYNLEI